MNKKASAALLAVILVAAVGAFVLFAGNNGITGQAYQTPSQLRPVDASSSAFCGKWCISSVQCGGKCGVCLNNKCINPRELRPVQRDPYTQCYIDCAREHVQCKNDARNQREVDACARALNTCNQGCLQYL